MSQRLVIATHHQHMRVVCPVVVCSTGEKNGRQKNLRPVMCVCKRLYVDLMSFWWKANHQLAIKMWFTLRHESENVPSSHKVTTEEHSGVESIYEDDVSTMMGWWWRRQQQHLKDRQEQAHKLQWRKVLGVMYDIYSHSCISCGHIQSTGVKWNRPWPVEGDDDGQGL